MDNMQDTKNISIGEYDYPLPDNRIAKFPLTRRDQSKLLLYNKGVVSEDVFANLPKYIPDNALMVFNNTKVIMARLLFRKTTGALIEVFLLEPLQPADYQVAFQTSGACEWCCLVGNLKKWKEGPLERMVEVNGKKTVFTATRVGETKTGQRIAFSWDNEEVSFAELIDAVGELPIPPYLNRESQESDKTTYQTVYSKIKGSVAAPTAGLHFTQEVLQALDAKGVDREEITLHVGAGTFKPVKSASIEGHEMHTEHIYVNRSTFEKLLAHGCEAVAVGTTSVRTLESLYYIGAKLVSNPNATPDELHVNQWEPYENAPDIPVDRAIREILEYLDRNGATALRTSTQIIIAPGYEYKIVKRLVTNFHQPKSTLLLLVSAFVKGDWRKIYDYALTHDFRFLSYGDSSLIMP